MTSCGCANELAAEVSKISASAEAVTAVNRQVDLDLKPFPMGCGDPQIEAPIQGLSQPDSRGNRDEDLHLSHTGERCVKEPLQAL